MPLSSTEGRYLLNGEGCLAHTGHKNFECEAARKAGHFLLISGPEKTTIWAGPGLHWYVDCTMNKKKNIGKVLKMDDIASSVSSVFMKNTYAAHADAG